MHSHRIYPGITGGIGEGDNEGGRSDPGLALPLAPLTARIPPAEARGIPGGPAAREDAGGFAAGTRGGDPFAGSAGPVPATTAAGESHSLRPGPAPLYDYYHHHQQPLPLSPSLSLPLSFFVLQLSKK